MKAEERQRLWESYQKNATQELREQIIVEYAPLVKIVAGRLNVYLGSNVEYDDLVGYGQFGLLALRLVLILISKTDRSEFHLLCTPFRFS